MKKTKQNKTKTLIWNSFWGGKSSKMDENVVMLDREKRGNEYDRGGYDFENKQINFIHEIMLFNNN